MLVSVHVESLKKLTFLLHWFGGFKPRRRCVISKEKIQCISKVENIGFLPVFSGMQVTMPQSGLWPCPKLKKNEH